MSIIEEKIVLLLLLSHRFLDPFVRLNYSPSQLHSTVPYLKWRPSWTQADYARNLPVHHTTWDISLLQTTDVELEGDQMKKQLAAHQLAKSTAPHQDSRKQGYPRGQEENQHSRALRIRKDIPVLAGSLIRGAQLHTKNVSRSRCLLSCTHEIRFPNIGGHGESRQFHKLGALTLHYCNSTWDDPSKGHFNRVLQGSLSSDR